MSKRRRTSSVSSSLDLFLDTISNTFGGIVFVAILVAVVLQMRSKEAPQPSDGYVSPEEYAQTQDRISELSAQRHRLSISLIQLRQMQGTPEGADLQRLQEDVKNVNAELDAALVRHSDFAIQLTELKGENAEIVEELAELRQQLLESQAELELKQSALDEHVADNLEVLKLPTVQTSYKSGVIVFLRYGKVYAVYKPSGKDETYDQHVRTTATRNAIEIVFMPDGGWDLSNPSDFQAAQAYFTSYSRGSVFINAGVFADSFKLFADLKAMLVAMDLDYQISLFPDSAQIVITEATELPRVQ